MSNIFVSLSCITVNFLFFDHFLINVNILFLDNFSESSTSAVKLPPSSPTKSDLKGKFCFIVTFLFRNYNEATTHEAEAKTHLEILFIIKSLTY